MKSKWILFILIILCLGIYCKSNLYVSIPENEVSQNPTIYGNVNVSYEMPKINEDDYIIKHIGYTLSYNRETNCPNWVAWELTYEESGANDIKRNNSFKEDNIIPKENRVKPSDYRGTGYDRGHMCPAADMKWSIDAMESSFYMSNICPQAPTLNRQWWEHLESACRRWAITNEKIWICCGPIYYDENKTYIGDDILIRVPDAFFKVVLSLEEGNERTIGFIYWNDNSRQPMENVTTTVDDIEILTGYDFFYQLEDSLELKIESTYDLKKWE